MGAAASFHHVGLTVADLETALRFWRDGLGLVEVRRFESDEADLGAVVGEPGAHVRAARLRFEDGGPLCLDLFHYLAPAAGRHVARMAEVGAAHVAVACDRPEALAARLLGHGGSLVGEARVLGGVGCVYVRDPDGHVLELQERGPEV